MSVNLLRTSRPWIFFNILRTLYFIACFVLLIFEINLDPTMSGATGPLALQWGLNETITGAFTFSRDPLIAATSDNVQVAALAAVESFGTTLAICEEIEIRVQKCVSRDRNLRPVQFLKSLVGFAAGMPCFKRLAEFDF